MILDRSRYRTIREISESSGVSLHTAWHRLRAWKFPVIGFLKIPGVVRPSKLYDYTAYMKMLETARCWSKTNPLYSPKHNRTGKVRDWRIIRDASGIPAAIHFLRYTKHYKLARIARVMHLPLHQIISVLENQNVPQNQTPGQQRAQPV